MGSSPAPSRQLTLPPRESWSPSARRLRSGGASSSSSLTTPPSRALNKRASLRHQLHDRQLIQGLQEGGGATPEAPTPATPDPRETPRPMIGGRKRQGTEVGQNLSQKL